MTYKIIKSAIKIQILAVLYINKKEMFGRQLEKIIGCAPSILYQKVEELKSLGYVKKEISGRKMYISLTEQATDLARACSILYRNELN